MRYRKLDADGDMTFGHGQQDFLRDTPDAVAQAVVTRLRLLAGEWFLDLADGTPWQAGVMGKHTQATYDPVIRRRILQTEGVTGISEYTSVFDGAARRLTVTATIDTVYGHATFQEVM